MKVNKWTMGLAAAGLVSLPLAVQAEEKAASPVMTALSSTTISGYVDTAAHWVPGTGNTFSPPFLYNEGKADGFNLNKAKVNLSKPLGEENWGAGYELDMLFGPDASVFNTTSLLGGDASDFAIQQAYVVVGAPVRNGINFKMGVFDSIIGYESHDSYKDPNYTRSYAVSLEPRTHTGILATYRFFDWLGIAGGIANTIVPTINLKPWQAGRAESSKTYMGAFELAAPESMGFLAGSKLFAGAVTGFGGSPQENQDNYYIGATVATPIKYLKVGGSLDFVEHFGGLENVAPSHAYAGYVTYQQDKWGLAGRAEYAEAGAPGNQFDVFALTGTISYDLWRNVLSRLEIRWDHSTDGEPHFGAADAFGRPTKKNDVLVAANLVYKF